MNVLTVLRPLEAVSVAQEVSVGGALEFVILRVVHWRDKYSQPQNLWLEKMAT